MNIKGIFISVGLDGKVIKSRLEPNNQLALLESIQITLSDLPKHLYRESTNRSVGLFGVSIFKKWENKQQLWIATETGVLIQLEEKLNKINKHYSKMKIFEKEQQNNLFLLILERRIFICKTLDGRILQRIEFEEDGHFNNNSQIEKLLPIGRSRCEISILTDTNLLFILSTNQQKQKINNTRRISDGNELIVWDILNDELLLRETQISEDLETFTLDKLTGNIMIGISFKDDGNSKNNVVRGENQKKYFLNFYEIVFE